MYMIIHYTMFIPHCQPPDLELGVDGGESILLRECEEMRVLQEQLIDVRHTFLFHLCHPGIETVVGGRGEREGERDKRNHHT